MNKAVSLYGLLGLFAGAIFSSCICGTPKNSKAENDCSLMGKIGEFSSSLCNIVIIFLPAQIEHIQAWLYIYLSDCRNIARQHNTKNHLQWLRHSCNRVNALPNLKGLQVSCTLYNDLAILGGIYTFSILYVRVIIKLRPDSNSDIQDW